MSDKANGGPAFPMSYMQSTQDLLSEKQWKDINARGEHFPAFVPAATSGMSLRDYFAAHALVLCADAPVMIALRDEAKARNMESDPAIARFVYIIADAMLAERAK